MKAAGAPPLLSAAHLRKHIHTQDRGGGPTAVTRPGRRPVLAIPTPAVRLQSPAVRPQSPAVRPQSPAVPAPTPGEEGEALEADLAVHEVVGRGAHSVVYRATRRSTGAAVALKTLLIERSDDAGRHAAQILTELAVGPARTRAHTRAPPLVQAKCASPWRTGPDLASVPLAVHRRLLRRVRPARLSVARDRVDGLRRARRRPAAHRPAPRAHPHHRRRLGVSR